MPFWQLTAAFVAGMMALAAAVGFIRYPRPLMVVIVGLLAGLPIVGLAAYAIVPGPVPDPGLLLWLAFVPAVAGLTAAVAMLAWMSARRTTLTFANLELLSNGTLVGYGGLVLGVSDLLGLWQPAWGVANVCLNAAWVLAWIPRRLRTSATETAVEIAAPLARAYSFIADPVNWPAYQEDVVSVSVRPAGSLAPGTEVSVTQRYESGVRGPRMLPDTITTSSVVDEVTADGALSMHLAERPASRSRVEFSQTGSGRTRIATTAHVVVPFRFAVFGAVVELWFRRGERAAKAQRNLERLKRILEAP